VANLAGEHSINICRMPLLRRESQASARAGAVTTDPDLTCITQARTTSLRRAKPSAIDRFLGSSTFATLWQESLISLKQTSQACSPTQAINLKRWTWRRKASGLDAILMRPARVLCPG